MPPKHLEKLIEQEGKRENLPAGQIFHAQAFDATMFMLKKGYVKRYQITKEDKHVIELIYGPGHIFPLSQLYRKLFSVEQNQDHLVYVYQAMTDIEILRIKDARIEAELQKDHELFIDLYYESGLRLKANIDRLASNALLDDYKKVAHQIVCLADDFGTADHRAGVQRICIQVPLTPTDIAEQLNISTEVAEAVLDSLKTRNLIDVTDNMIAILNLNLLKDVYL